MVSLTTRVPFAVVTLAVVLCGLTMLASAPTARGAGGAFILVNSSADADDLNCNQQVLGGCTLREAIKLANSNPGADTIIFAPAAFGDPPIIKLNSELPYFTDPEGVTVNGSLGANMRVQVSPATSTSINYGLVFTGTESVHNVTVNNLSVKGFVYDSIQVCAKPVESTCEGLADAITLDNVEVSDSQRNGIDIFGAGIYNVQLTAVDCSTTPGAGLLSSPRAISPA